MKRTCSFSRLCSESIEILQHIFLTGFPPLDAEKRMIYSYNRLYIIKRKAFQCPYSVSVWAIQKLNFIFDKIYLLCVGIG